MLYSADSVISAAVSFPFFIVACSASAFGGCSTAYANFLSLHTHYLPLRADGLHLALLLSLPGCPGRACGEAFPHRDIVFQASTGWFFTDGISLRKGPRAASWSCTATRRNLSTHVNSVLWLVKEGFNIFIIDYADTDGQEENRISMAFTRTPARRSRSSFPFPRRTRPCRGPGPEPRRGHRRLHGRPIAAQGPHPGSRRRERFLQLSPHRPREAGQFLAHLALPVPVVLDRVGLVQSEQWIGQVTPVPVLILHGMNDPVVPTHHGRPVIRGGAGAEAVLADGDARGTSCPLPTGRCGSAGGLPSDGVDSNGPREISS